jgi:hypothetical protein
MLGCSYLFYTFYTNKFDAGDEAITTGMKNTSPVLTKKITMWNAWIGFNASYSLGAMLVAAFYAPFAVTNIQLIRKNIWSSILPVIIGILYLSLKKKYWLKIPFIGILISTICFVAVAALTNTRSKSVGNFNNLMFLAKQHITINQLEVQAAEKAAAVN